MIENECIQMGEKASLIRSIVPRANTDTVATVVKFTEELTKSNDPAVS